MTDQPPDEAGQAPVPDAAPAPAPAPRTIAQLEAELAAARAQAAGPGDVLLRIESGPGKPYALIRGGYTIGTDPTPVPQHAVPMLLEAAADVGVTIVEA